MNCDKMLTAYAISRHKMMVGHRMDPIASEYGTPLILFTWLMDCVMTYEQEEDKLPVLVFGTEQVNL